ncbi:MAG TPA: hypothetical protein VGM90_07325 [Kofleriaceae bacterium]|jgi:hypothetical protein
MKAIVVAGIVSALMAGCATDGDDASNTDPGGGKGDGSGECADPMYGDGVCQADLSCGVPDIDCYRTFATDAEASTWFAPQYGYPVIAETDPRYIRTRALVDKAWDLFKAANPMGKLADAHLALVMLEDPNVNAFVTSDAETGKAAVSIQVLAGLYVDGVSDDDILGVMFHELEHLYGLHVLQETPDKVRRFYLADGAEPIGAHEANDANIADRANQWRAMAGFAGPYDTGLLGELPYGGNVGPLFQSYLAAVQTRDNGTCAQAATAVSDLYTELAPRSVEFDESLNIDDTLSTRIKARLDALSACVGHYPYSLQDFLATQGQEWIDYMNTVITSDEQWLLPESAFETITLLSDDRHGQMRAIESKFQQVVGKPWSAMRFYSFEEAADDMSVKVMKAAKTAHPELFVDAAPGVAGLMKKMMPVDQQTECEQSMTAGGLVPYGLDVADEHHGTCWRVAHARQLWNASSPMARVVPPTREPHEVALPKVAKRVY